MGMVVVGVAVLMMPATTINHTYLYIKSHIQVLNRAITAIGDGDGEILARDKTTLRSRLLNCCKIAFVTFRNVTKNVS